MLARNSGVRRVVRTDVEGRFAFAGLVAGEAELVVLPHHGNLGCRRTVAVEKDLALDDVVLERPRQEPLRLWVRDPEGAAQAFTHVVADQDEGLRRAYGQADVEGEVVLVSAGREAAQASLRQGLAMGADRAVLVKHDTVEGADGLSRARVLAEAVKEESPDMVLVGKYGVGPDECQTGPMMAELLDWPHAAAISKIELEEGAFTVERFSHSRDDPTKYCFSNRYLGNTTGTLDHVPFFNVDIFTHNSNTNIIFFKV